MLGLTWMILHGPRHFCLSLGLRTKCVHFTATRSLILYCAALLHKRLYVFFDFCSEPLKFVVLIHYIIQYVLHWIQFEFQHLSIQEFSHFFSLILSPNIRSNGDVLILGWKVELMICCKHEGIPRMDYQWTALTILKL